MRQPSSGSLPTACKHESTDYLLMIVNLKKKMLVSNEQIIEVVNIFRELHEKEQLIKKISQIYFRNIRNIFSQSIEIQAGKAW